MCTIPKLLIVGDSGVGKTALLLRFTDEMFTTNYISTLGIDFKIKTVQVEGKTVKLQLWDTAGQERFRTITAAYFRGANGVIFAYSCASMASFDNLTRWLKEAEEKCSRDVCHLLVATKSDLQNHREVSTELGKTCARQNRMRFFETSAKTAENVEIAFVELTRDIMKHVAANAQKSEKSTNKSAIPRATPVVPLSASNGKKQKCSC